MFEWFVVAALLLEALSTSSRVFQPIITLEDAAIRPLSSSLFDL